MAKIRVIGQPSATSGGTPIANSSDSYPNNGSKPSAGGGGK